jgi:hypothetical protein
MATVQARGIDIPPDRELQLSTPTLTRLVKLDAAAGEEKGLDDFARAGRRLKILKQRIAPGQWNKWLRKHFEFSLETARRWMRLAERTASLEAGPVRARTLSQATGDDRPPGHRPSWYAAAREEHAKREQHAKATAHYTAQREVRWAEKRAVRTRATEIIDAGYRVVAGKYHPDKGGSHAEMSRTNKARDSLRAALKFV